MTKHDEILVIKLGPEEPALVNDAPKRRLVGWRKGLTEAEAWERGRGCGGSTPSGP